MQADLQPALAETSWLCGCRCGQHWCRGHTRSHLHGSAHGHLRPALLPHEQHGHPQSANEFPSGAAGSTAANRQSLLHVAIVLHQRTCFFPCSTLPAFGMWPSFTTCICPCAVLAKGLDGRCVSACRSATASAGLSSTSSCPGSPQALTCLATLAAASPIRPWASPPTPLGLLRPMDCTSA